jgi:hypothetical protein
LLIDLHEDFWYYRIGVVTDQKAVTVFFSRFFLDSSSFQMNMFAWLISHQPAILFSHNKSATSNQPAVLFSQNKPAPGISHQPTEQAERRRRANRLLSTA